MSSKIVVSKKTFENSIKRDIFPKLRSRLTINIAKKRKANQLAKRRIDR